MIVLYSRQFVFLTVRSLSSQQEINVYVSGEVSYEAILTQSNMSPTWYLMMDDLLQNISDGTFWNWVQTHVSLYMIHYHWHQGVGNTLIPWISLSSSWNRVHDRIFWNVKFDFVAFFMVNNTSIIICVLFADFVLYCFIDNFALFWLVWSRIWTRSIVFFLWQLEQTDRQTSLICLFIRLNFIFPSWKFLENPVRHCPGEAAAADNCNYYSCTRAWHCSCSCNLSGCG